MRALNAYAQGLRTLLRPSGVKITLRFFYLIKIVSFIPIALRDRVIIAFKKDKK